MLQKIKEFRDILVAIFLCVKEVIRFYRSLKSDNHEHCK